MSGREEEEQFMASIPSDENAQCTSSTCNSDDQCEDCNEQDSGNCDDHSSSSFSAFPVRYSTGEVRLVTQDLGADNFGISWGHTRSYSNRVTAPDEGVNGSSWFVQELPYLVNANPDPGDPNKGKICVVRIINDALWFVYDAGSGGYMPKFFTEEKLTHDAVAKEFLLTDTAGRRTKFFNFDATIPADKRGQFKSYTDAFGRETTASYGVNNLIGSFVQSFGGRNAGYFYDYYSSGINANRLQYVTYRIDGTDVRRAKYDYYDGTDANGSAGDLKRVTVQEFRNSVWNTLGVTYYRYYKTGDQDGVVHGLKYVLSPLGYSRMVALGITPEISTDGQLESFAKHRFRYTSDRRVKSEAVNGGARNYDFTITQSAHADGYNNWKQKTVEVLPDGNQNVAYTNYAGQVILKVFVRSGTAEKWYEYSQYSSVGLLVLRAESSAVLSYNETVPTLVTLQDNAGLVRLYDYYSASPGAGGAPNRRQYEKVKQGSLGSPIKVREWQYAARTAVSQTIYFPWKDISYQSDASGGSDSVETTYTYTWQGNFGIDQKTTTWPVVPVSQNGSGTAESRVEAFDALSNLIWVKDERGYITGYSYDAVNGGLIQKVEDASAGTPWTPVAGAHLNLTTDYTLDNLGRVTRELGPEHAIDIGGVSTLVRRANWAVYLDDIYETRSAAGYLKTSDGSYTLVNPVTINKRDEARRVIDEIQAVRASTSGALSASDSFPQSSWVRWSKNIFQNSVGLAAKRVYFSIPASGEGVPGVNYDQAGFGYDIMKRLIREQSSGGTITRTVYHPMGWVLERWVGINDAGATDSDPSGNGAAGNDMVKVGTSEYDGNTAGGDGNLTRQVQHVDATTTRTTNYGYDFRNRRTSTDGEIDFYEAVVYDNLDRAVQVDRRNATAAGNLIGRSATRYDKRGRVYQSVTYGVDPSTGTVGNALTNNSWFDPAGNPIKQQNAGSQAFQKSFYDAVNRLTKQYTAYDSAGDVVMQQIELSYDAAGSVVQQLTRDRFHDATGTGELTNPNGAQPQARVSYTAQWPDAVGRQRNNANYGTNGANAFVRPTIAPARSDTVLLTTTEYNDRGEAYRVVDAQGMVTQVVFDHAGRVIQRLENYVSGGTASDQNRETDYVYNVDGQVLTLTAKNATTGDQVTRYVYGTTLSDSNVASNALLRAIIYPDSNDPVSPLSGTDHVEFKYNRFGEIKEKKDQLQTVHLYEYDLLGRQVQDRVTVLGTGVDGTVRRISRTYEVRGLPEKISSYDNATVGSGAIVNETQKVYNNFGQLTAEYQSHSGAVNTATTPKVQYAYANGSANQTRPTSFTYPNGRIVTLGYSGTSNDALSRAAEFVDSDGSATHLADYLYLGFNRSVEANSPQPGVKLTYIKQGAEPVGDAGDQYTGLDRFGRVVDQRWIKAGSALERIQCGFDRAGNRLWRDNLVAASGQDEFYTYDGLYQLKILQRGDLNGTKTGISGTPTWQEDLTFDPTGNWNNYLTKTSGTTNLNQNRTHNKANELTQLNGASTFVSEDLAGNMTKVPKVDSWTSAFDLVYDAWYRLVQVKDGATTVVTYGYDGETRRTTKVTGATTRHFYYSSQWQVLEERVGTGTTPDRQFVWGLRYLDDLILRDRSTTGTLDERLYCLHDYFNATAVTDSTGTVQERYGYDAFGKSRVLTPAFAARAASLYEWETRYAAYRWDAETSLYQVRYRYLHPTLGRWITRDPIEYEGGLNLYTYADNNATNGVDVAGLITTRQCTAAEDAACSAGCVARGEYFLKCLWVQAGGIIKIWGLVCTCMTCTPAVQATLQAAVDAACQVGKRACKGDDSCEELATKFALNTACAVARAAINKQCFKGGDRTHKGAEQDATNAATNCACLYAKKKCGMNI